MQKQLSKSTKKALEAQYKKGKYDLIHQLMLEDITRTSDGFYLQRDKGDIGYNRFLGNPHLGSHQLDRMAIEIRDLPGEAEVEVLERLYIKYPEIYEKLKEHEKEMGNYKGD